MRKGMMGFVVLALALILLAGVVGTWFFWPHTRGEQSVAFFSALQFVASFALIFVTLLYVWFTSLYVKATQDMVADQNSPPRFEVRYHTFPQTSPFVVNFQLEIANPGVRTTSVGIKSARIGQISTTNVCFEGMQTRTTVPARDLVKVNVEATFDSVPKVLGQSVEAVLVFDEIFHGLLPPVKYMV